MEFNATTFINDYMNFKAAMKRKLLVCETNEKARKLNMNQYC